MTVFGKCHILVERRMVGKVQPFIIFLIFFMESGKLKTLNTIGKVFYSVGYTLLILSGLAALYVIVILRGSSMLAVLVPILFYGALIMAGGLLFQWLPQVSETLTKILNNIERLNKAVEKLAQQPEGDASVREPDGEDI